MKKIEVSPSLLILCVAIYISCANNNTLLIGLNERLDIFSLQGGGYVLALFSLMIALLFLVMSLFAQKIFLKPVLVFFLILAAVLGYFTTQLHVIFDEDMILNVAETIRDNNKHEGMELVSLPLLEHVFLFGVLPAIAIVLVKVKQLPWRKALLSKVVYFVAVIAFTVTLILLNYKYVSFFSRENRNLRIYITPLYALMSLDKFIRHDLESQKATFNVIGDDAVQNKPYHRKTVGIMVVGETARADHLSLNGYNKETNPLLKKQQVINFPDTQSCGTSTAYSVPCMFSFLDREHYSPAEAQKYSNVLDVLSKAGVTVFWKDNNSSCKGVCLRIDNVNLKYSHDTTSPFFNKGEYFDEIMLDGLEDYINKIEGDVLIVLHGMGSHGPSYYKRFPDSFAQFRPFCKKSSPQECNSEEIINAYDNTILYTDYILSKTIDLLKSNAGKYESFMMYASDHGESLGENGIYLHGLPYMLAPAAQTHIPFIIWQSDEYMSNNNASRDYLQKLSGHSYSHDNISHTLLGFFKVQTGLYQKELDIFGQPE